MKTQIIERVCLLIAVTVLSSTARGQSAGGFDLAWSTIDGGGGGSTGGVYTVTGTIGQPDAAWPVDQNGFSVQSTGGIYTLVGGFWSVIQQDAVWRLKLDQHGTNLVLSWPAGAPGVVVQSATQLVPTANWSNFAGTPVRVGDEFQLIV